MGGKFIVVEGLDAIGKDTVIDRLKKEFSGDRYVFVQDPSPKLVNLRETLLTNELEDSTRLFLYLAARSELLKKQILPALEQGKVVVSNRYALSTYAYQGLMFSKKDIFTLSKVGGLERIPDKQIVLLKKGQGFTQTEKNVMDEFCDKFREQIGKRYYELALDPKNNAEIVWVDGKTKDEVYNEVKTIFLASV